MKRNVVSLFLILLLMLSLCIPVYASSRAATYAPTLSFSGTTAICDVTISAYGYYIDADLELWEGSQLLASWPVEGMHAAGTTGTRIVLSGHTYTLTISGTVGDNLIHAVPITDTCP